MKISITKTDRAQIRQLRDQMASALSASKDSEKERSQLSARQEKLSGEIAKLEKSCALDESAATKLAAKRIQSERIGKRLAELPDADAVAVDAIGGAGLMRAFDYATDRAMRPVIENFQKQIARELRPWCDNDNVALGLAMQSSITLSFNRKALPRFSVGQFHVGLLSPAIQFADEILAGNLNWKFDPKLKAKK